MDINIDTIFELWSTPKIHTWQLAETIYHDQEKGHEQNK